MIQEVEPPPAPAKACQAHLNIQNLGLERGGKWLFRGLDLEIPRGKFVALVGPSGVGKTTLLHIIAGMVDPDEGNVTYCCEENCYHAPKSFQKEIGIVFQNYRLVPNANLLDNVLVGRLGRHPWWRTLLTFSKQEKNRAREILLDLGLAHLERQWACEISGGEQQRVALARALLQDSEIILADEPVSNLDSYLSGRVLGMLKLEAEKKNRTIICVLHQAELVSRFADYSLSLHPTKPDQWKFRKVS